MEERLQIQTGTREEANQIQYQYEDGALQEVWFDGNQIQVHNQNGGTRAEKHLLLNQSVLSYETDQERNQEKIEIPEVLKIKTIHQESGFQKERSLFDQPTEVISKVCEQIKENHCFTIEHRVSQALDKISNNDFFVKKEIKEKPFNFSGPLIKNEEEVYAYDILGRAIFKGTVEKGDLYTWVGDKVFYDEHVDQQMIENEVTQYIFLNEEEFVLYIPKDGESYLEIPNDNRDERICLDWNTKKKTDELNRSLLAHLKKYSLDGKIKLNHWFTSINHQLDYLAKEQQFLYRASDVESLVSQVTRELFGQLREGEK